jgi:hypothetical protein
LLTPSRLGETTLVGESLVRFKSSFLVRWWVLDHGGSRIEVEHIQSKAKTVVQTSHEAVDWMSRRAERVSESPDESGSSGT